MGQPLKWMPTFIEGGVKWAFAGGHDCGEAALLPETITFRQTEPHISPSIRKLAPEKEHMNTKGVFHLVQMVVPDGGA